MTRAHGAPAGVTFAALAVPNYRRYIAGQAISLIGTWMQMAAQSWLVLTLTGSAPTSGWSSRCRRCRCCCSAPTAAWSPTASTSAG